MLNHGCSWGRMQAWACLAARNGGSTKRRKVRLHNAVFNWLIWIRYVNSDFVLLSALSIMKVPSIMAIYDVMCQWIVNFRDRIHSFPEAIQLDLEKVDFRTAIPKLHLPVHGPQCQGRYSLNWLPGVGRTDGEVMERIWASANAAAPSTKEMTAGHRHDILNGIWDCQNWRKLVNCGEYS